SGGSTPRRLFELLGGELAREFPVEGTRIFWCDERCVPYDHPWSNYGSAFELWFGPAGFPAGNLHPVPVELGPEAAARSYDRLLRERFADGRHSLDLCLLGMGGDGHVASLFPASDALAEGEKLAVAVRPGGNTKPNVERVTLTIPALAAAGSRLLLAAGAEKLPVIRAINDGNPSVKDLPAAILDRMAGIHWLVVDKNA
ncbi:MAG: 6-phosphogluconolactonase, partial [Deltaproteobacteria bacterium]